MSMFSKDEHKKNLYKLKKVNKMKIPRSVIAPKFLYEDMTSILFKIRQEVHVIHQLSENING